MKKQLNVCVTALAAMLFALVLLATSGTAEAEGIEFSITGGVLTISGTGDMENYDDEYRPPWGTLITQAVIESGVTSIGASAFSGCTNLASITIPDSVTNIGASAFSGCSGLASITIPDGVTIIWVDTFSNCTSLASITIPDSVTSIGNGAFSGCSGLTSIAIPDNVTSIGGFAFSGCTSLSSITIPDNVTYIWNYAFSGCTNLASITIPDSVTSIGNGAFSGCASLASITIPDSVSSIGVYAFSGCTSLTSIAIPAGVTIIGEYALSSCIELTDIWYDGTEGDWEQILQGLNWDAETNAELHFGTDFTGLGTVFNVPFTFSGSGSGSVTVTDIRNIPITLHGRAGSKSLDLWSGTVHIEAVPDAFNGLSRLAVMATQSNDMPLGVPLTNGAFNLDNVNAYSVEVVFTEILPGIGTQDDPWRIGQNHDALDMIAGCYEVTAAAAITERVTVTGDVHLILGESATLTAMKGINVSGDRSLTVSGTGALTAGADQHNAAIGGNSGQSAGTIVINGGVLTVNAGNFASGIGGGNQGGAGNITINGGTVNIQYAGSSSGIGTGKEGSGGSVTINGGTVNAKGRFGAGIGGGDKAPGIAVSITGGTVVAQSYNGGAGIGGGPYRNGGSVTISGGQVTAIGSVYPDTGQGAPGIGSGRPQTSGSTQLNGGTCEITGGTVIAIAGNTNAGNGAQAIGANYQDNPGTLTLGAGMKASTSEGAAAVCPKDRKPACRGGWVKVEPCGHSFYGGVCAWCGAQDGPATFGPAIFTLPASTGSIGANAFENAKMTAVDARNCASIGAEAFKGCAGLIQVRLPKDCQIDGTAFDGCTALIAVYAPAGGTTQTWAESLDIPFVAFPAGQ